MRDITCSIMIPVYNCEQYIAAALDSVLMQKTGYSIEIIIVNDGSTDKSGNIAHHYSELHDNVIVLDNDKNRGKGYSFMRAYQVARGRYFHVLDADDVFTSCRKLDRQIRFLETNYDYFAVGHNSIISYGDKYFSFLSNVIEEKSYTYEDCINNKVYCHTSSIMYRKIDEFLPEYFLLDPMRGDSAVFIYHLFKTKCKFKYFPDVYSLYNWHGNGIWTSMESEKQKKLNENMISCVQNHIVSNSSLPEWEVLNQRLKLLSASASDKNPRIRIWFKDLMRECILYCADVFNNTKFNYFNAVYSTSLVDQFCETVGRMALLQKGMGVLSQPYNDCAVIAVSGLSKGGGGIYNELRDLSSVLLTKYSKLYIVSSGWIQAPDEDWQAAFHDERIEVIHVDNALDCYEKTTALVDIFYRLHPKVLYPFITHVDVSLNASIQSGLAENIIMDFVYDHGLALGLNNSAIDSFIVKTDSQRDAINNQVPNAKFIMCPPLLNDKFEAQIYQPYRNGKLTTASASARVYKTQSAYKYSFADVVAAILKQTDGVHYHYGKLDADSLESFYNAFKKLDIDIGRFRHIEWADNLGQSMLDNGVDLFVATFPVCSARIVVELMSAGIPVLNHDVINPAIYPPADFCDSAQFLWRDIDELNNMISTLNSKLLSEKSRSARQWFKAHNDLETQRSRMISVDGVSYPQNDRSLIYIYDYDKLMKNDSYKSFFRVFFSKKKLGQRMIDFVRRKK